MWSERELGGAKDSSELSLSCRFGGFFVSVFVLTSGDFNLYPVLEPDLVREAGMGDSVITAFYW